MGTFGPLCLDKWRKSAIRQTAAKRARAARASQDGHKYSKPHSNSKSRDYWLLTQYWM